MTDNPHPRLLPLFGLAIAGLAGVRLSQSLQRLTAGRPRSGLNLHQRVDEVERWFSGEAVYEALPTAVYPPGSMGMLAPLGWLGEGTLTAYTVVTLLACTALGWGFRRIAGAGPWWLMLAPLATLAVNDGVALGQLHLVSLVAAVGALGLALRDEPHADLGAGLLFAVALIKPSSAVLFVPALGLLPRHTRALTVAAGVYGLATWLACAVREESPLRLVHQWWFRATEGARYGAEIAGYGSVHDLVGWLGIPRGSVIATLLVLFAGTLWTWRVRRADPWVVVGVLGIAARLGTYHRGYDDVLVLPAVAALLRVGDTKGRLVAVLVWGLLLVDVPGVVRTLSWLLALGSLMLSVRDGEEEARAGARATT